MRKFVPVLLVLSLTAMIGTAAQAEDGPAEPIVLSDDQMDRVTAGSTGLALALASAYALAFQPTVLSVTNTSSGIVQLADALLAQASSFSLSFAGD